MGDVKRWEQDWYGDNGHLCEDDDGAWVTHADHAREVEALLQERDAADAAVAKLEKLVEGQELMVISVEGDLAKAEAAIVDLEGVCGDAASVERELDSGHRETIAKLERRIAEMDRGSGMVGWVEEV